LQQEILVVSCSWCMV